MRADTPPRRVLGRVRHSVSEFFIGASLVLRGFGFWRVRPGVMALGMVPAVIAAAVIGTVLITVGLNVEAFAGALTPFADEWAERERGFVRALVAIVILTGIVIGMVYSFTALTLLIGDPFYERIWRAVENELGGFTPSPVRFWRSFGDGILLVLRAIAFGITTFIVGLIPVVGSALAAVLGPTLAGHLIARELSTRSFEARGIGASHRVALLRGSRARELGFGVMTQVLFLIPGGAIVVMPAAVVAATRFARHVVATSAAASDAQSEP